MRKPKKRMGGTTGSYLLRETINDVVSPSDVAPRVERDDEPTQPVPRPPRVPKLSLSAVKKPSEPAFSLTDALLGRTPPTAEPDRESEPATGKRPKLPPADDEVPLDGPEPAAEQPPVEKRSTMRPRPVAPEHVGRIEIDAVGTDSEPPAESPISIAVREACTSGPDEADPSIERVLRFPNAIETLALNFPGPLWFDRRQPHRRVPNAREISAIARALLYRPAEAAPHVARLLLAPNTDTRYYAALVAREMPTELTVQPLARLALDRDEGIRNNAIRALEAHRHLSEFNQMLAQLRATAADTSARPRWRARALVASAKFGDAGALDVMIECLGTRDRTLARAAHEALRRLTCHDLGTMRITWRRWQKRHGNNHRVQWLIEALADKRVELRADAFRQLCELTGEDFDLHENAAQPEYLEAQSKYLAWWRNRSFTG